MEKNDLLIKHAKEIEDERTTRRVLQTENDTMLSKAHRFFIWVDFFIY